MNIGTGNTIIDKKLIKIKNFGPFKYTKQTEFKKSKNATSNKYVDYALEIKNQLTKLRNYVLNINLRLVLLL